MTSWTVDYQAPQSPGISRLEYCSGLPCPPQGMFLSQESSPDLPHCWQIFPSEPLGKMLLIKDLLYWSPNLICLYFRDNGFKELIKVKWSLKGETPNPGGHQCALAQKKGQVRTQEEYPWDQREASWETNPPLAFHLWLPVSELWDNKFLLVK